METPNGPKALAVARKLVWQFDIMSTSFFLSRRALRPATHSGMPRWQDRLFIQLTRIADDATDYFQIRTGRGVEEGNQETHERAPPPDRVNPREVAPERARAHCRAAGDVGRESDRESGRP